MPSKILYQNINKFVQKYHNMYGAGFQHGTSPTVSVSGIFSIHYEYLRMFVINFFCLTAMRQSIIYSPCFFVASKTQTTFFLQTEYFP